MFFLNKNNTLYIYTYINKHNVWIPLIFDDHTTTTSPWTLTTVQQDFAKSGDPWPAVLLRQKSFEERSSWRFRGDVRVTFSCGNMDISEVIEIDFF
jgi:hypothetical protein